MEGKQEPAGQPAVAPVGAPAGAPASASAAGGLSGGLSQAALKAERGADEVEASSSRAADLPAPLSSESAPAASAAGASGRRRLLDSDDDSPLRPRGLKKSKFVSDSSDDEVVLAKMRVAPHVQSAAAATGGETQQNKKPQQLHNGTGRAAPPAKRKAAPHSRGKASSRSSGDSSSSSSSGSSSSSDSSSGEESDTPLTKSRPSAVKKSQGGRGDRKDVAKAKQAKTEKGKARGVRTPVAGRRNGEGGESDEDGGENEISMGSFDPKKRSAKDRLVAQFLRRWWYAWPQWPPENFDYAQELEKRKLKLVPLEEYEDLDDVDKEGYTKVYQISAFPGVFRDPHGNAIDLRPLEGRPCYKNAKQLSEIELLGLIAKAVRGQMAALKTSAFDETALLRALQQELEEVESELKQMQRRMDAAKGRA